MELPGDAEHGFDARAGNVDIEGASAESVVTAVRSLRNALGFFDSVVQSRD